MVAKPSVVIYHFLFNTIIIDIIYIFHVLCMFNLSKVRVIATFVVISSEFIDEIC